MYYRTLLLLGASLLSALAQAAGVESFSPQGEVKGVRQVSVAFDVDMVPLGDPRLSDPFTVECPAKGKGRWVDNRHWVYDFEHDLPAGLSCRFNLEASSLDGRKLAPASYSFTTGGPAVLMTLPDEGSQISEDQVFVLGLDAPVKEATLTGRFWCQAEGVAEKIPAQLLSGKDKAKVLAASENFFQGYLGVLAERHSLYLFDVRDGDRKEQLLRQASQPGAPVLVARCGRRLPADTRVNLQWEPGIETTSGIAVRDAQSLAYRTRPEFSARLHCEKLNPRLPCLPVLPMQLSFSAPVDIKSAAAITLSDGRQTWRGKTDADAQKSGYTRTLSFVGPFPEAANLTLKLPAKLKDQDGRALLNARSFPLKLKTDLAPPLAKFASDFGIYELNAQPTLPLTLRYVEQLTQSHAQLNAQRLVTQSPTEIIDWMRHIQAKSVDTYGPRVEKKSTARQVMDWVGGLVGKREVKVDENPISHYGAEDSIFEARHKIPSTPLPKPLPDRDTEVIGIPLVGAGFHIIEVASPRLGAALMDRPKPYHVRATALVTNLSVHFKRGDESSLVWVTALDSGQPVADAEVAVRDCTNHIHAKGRTDAQGLLRINQELPEENALPGCLDKYDGQFFVTAAKAGDFSFLLSHWGEGISPWRFNLYQTHWQGPFVAHAVLDRSLFRPGEEVGMKLFVRRKKSQGFGYVDAPRLANEIILRHDGSGEEVKLPVKWDGFGIAELTYQLPKEAQQGSYSIVIPHTLRGRNRDQLQAGEFRVANYRVPSVKARLSGPAQAVNAPAIQLDLQAAYLAGGAASQLPITLRGQLQPHQPSFADYEEASFANGRVKVGRQDERAEWMLGEYDTDAEMPTPAAEADLTPLKTLKFKLDASGSARQGWQDLPRADRPRLLVAEAEYRDANGEVRSAATRVPLYPSKLLIGVQPDSWVQAKAQQRFRIIALDTAGKPQAGVAVQGRLYQRSWYSYRKRVIGGFYAYEHGAETKALAETCAGSTDARGLFFCETRSATSGSLIFEATANDADGNTSYAQQDFWVPEGDGWLDASDQDRMDLIPERRHYEIGEKAKLHLRMPFPAARVLVSVEREGVLDAWVTEVKRDHPVIEVPIKPEYGPNVFISALAIRGRVGGVQPTAMIDLGKPAFRMGMTEIRTGWSGYALKVDLSTDKTSYRTREKVKVKVQVRRPDGSVPGKNAEIALAAVDEGLLELAPNTSWKLLDAMLQRRGIAVTTSTGQMQVVGKRHYGRKAVAAGGGGGNGPARELFDTRIFWQARIKLDEQGEAQVEVPLNDSLTRFRIVAVANTNVGRFGTGETDVAVTQDLQILSGAAPLVREGDRLKVYFTLRNTSDHAMDVDLSPSLNGHKLAARSEHLDPGQGREIALPLEVPYNLDQINWELQAQEKNGPARDRLKIKQQVKEAVPVRTFQATLTQLAEPLSVPVQRPADAIPGRGGIGVKFQASLADDLVGVREYMNYYPWTCLEQRASKAIARSDQAAWESIAASLPAYLDRDGLAKYWPDLTEGSDTLTTYLLAISHEAGYELPEGSQQRMIEGLKGFIEGRVLRDSALNTADLAVRKLAAMDALSRYPEGRVQANWLESFSLTPNLWPTSALIDWTNLLVRSPHLPQRDEHLKEARTILRARLNFAGTVMGFATERNDNWWWLMVGGDSNANRMTLAALDATGDDAWSAADLGRLMRGSLARQQHGHWNTTVANAWGVLATKRFSQKLESTPVTGSSQATLAEHSHKQDWSQATTGSGLLAWPAGQQPLKLEHQGTGKPWITLSSLAAIPLKDRLDAGYHINREVQAIEQREPGVWHRGDVLRVKLTVDAQTDMGWVALLDPIPAGATILGTGLGGDSALLTQGEKRQGWVWPAYEERTHDSFRAYYQFVPKGQFTVEYTLRLNNEGHFNLPTARVEAMYAPELFGELPVADVVVKP